MLGKVCLRPVGTRGGRGEGWGPCACPRGDETGWPHGTQTNRHAARTSTRPPHPPHCAPCPYRMQDAPSPIRSAPFIRRLGRKRPNGYAYPIRLAKSIRCPDYFVNVHKRSSTFLHIEPCLKREPPVFSRRVLIFTETAWKYKSQLRDSSRAKSKRSGFLLPNWPLPE